MFTPIMFALLFTVNIHADPVRPWSSKHPDAVLGLALSPDNKQLASLSRDGQVLIWDVKTQKVIHDFTSPRLAVALAWPEASTLYSIGSMGLANIQPTAGKILTLKRIERRIDAGVISPDGRFAAVGNTHFVGQLLNASSGERLMPYPAPTEWSYAMAVSPDSKLLAIGGCNPGPDAITLLETKGFTTVRGWPTKLKDAFGLRFAPNGKLLASVGDSDVVKLWNVADGSLAQSFPLAQHGAVAVAFSPDNKYLVVCSGVPVKQLSPNHFDINHNDNSKTSKPIASYLQLWSLETNKVIWRSDALTTWATSVTFLPTGQFVTGNQDGTVRFWIMPK